ncbi:HET-domain-containing protein [Clathrospora elynae]|uniref:HET-domain-containing protein n=1 Tax=Clathrospora elynae TaxID=706981 RepID=A0A6A5T6B6_9PLEO|nr:HET-domain-containing protein [Clathrospora elynae]
MMRLCKYCIENILESKESWEYHRGSWESLVGEWDTDEPPCTPERASTTERRENCLFCSTLRQDIEKLAPALTEERYAVAWPVCRWNIRSLAKIQESLETVVVTFRYVPPVSEIKVVGYKEVELPTRTFFLFPEDHVQPLPTVEQLGPSTNLADNGGLQIRSWVENCDIKHSDCMKRRKTTSKSKRFVPTRLLDISGAPTAPIRVIETATTLVQGPYCTLSHCWGDIKFQRLLDTNRERFMKEGVPWQLFTKNFQDAIEIARALDVGYIWIDSLCIIQESKTDWDREAGHMHLVYRNSYCNIAVAASKDSTGGAFRKRDPKDVAPVRYRPADDSPFFLGKTWVVVSEDLWESELVGSVLYARGWVFQERMLSPRILHFAENQIFWDCPSLSACETLPAGLPQPMDSVAGPDRHWRARLQVANDNHEPLAGAIDQSMASFWKTAVRKYTSCNLTNGSDKLIAMWGIAKLVRDALGVEYGDGLWEENLEDQLAWRVAECKLTQRPSESTEKKLARAIPSWSWASMDGEIIIPDRMSDMPHRNVTDHDCRPLCFDLKGRGRIVDMTPNRSVVEAPTMPARGISDTGAELQRRSAQLHKEQPDLSDEKGFYRSSSPEIMDRDDEPKLNSKSIRIKGHVGYGILEGNKDTEEWELRIDGIPNLEIEAFPDTIPHPEDPVAIRIYFVVLSAKQVFIPPSFMGDAQPLPGRDSESHRLASIDELVEAGFDDDSEDDAQFDDEFDYSGHGILMKYAGDNRFLRTGSFRFRNTSEQVYNKLQETESWRFWLD